MGIVQRDPRSRGVRRLGVLKRIRNTASDVRACTPNPMTLEHAIMGRTAVQASVSAAVHCRGEEVAATRLSPDRCRSIS